jgi:regulator of PEP synthase PpsR (kinase-PPPase family)
MATSTQILVLSDATGATAEAVASSALIQFSGGYRIRRFSFVRTGERVREILDETDGQDRVVVFSFADPELGQQAAALCAERELAAVDLLTPVTSMLAETFKREPEPNPAGYPFLPDHVFELAQTIEYTLDHDDGKGTETLNEADLIIFGLSRAGKTPTSIYLSCRKLKVANVPIVEGVPIPEQARRAPAPKVGFRVSLERQVQLRRERSERMGTVIPGYTDQRSVLAELEHCEQVFRSIPGIVTVDVSSLAVEEIADWITRNVL